MSASPPTSPTVPPTQTARPGEPAFYAIYGDSGSGKSTLAAFDFPNFYFVGPVGGVSKVWRQVVGLPESWLLSDRGALWDLEALVAVLPAIAKSGVGGLVVDDMTILTDRTLRKKQHEFQGSKNRYAPFTAVMNITAMFRDTCRDWGLHTVCLCHPMHAWVDERSGIYYAGRPKLAGREAPLSFPGLCDGVLRAETAREQVTGVVGALPLASPLAAEVPLAAFASAVLAVPAPLGVIAPASTPWDENWPGVLRHDPTDSRWITKCRLHTPDRVPMALGEILRFGGYDIPRVKGEEWLDAVIAEGAKALARGSNEGEVLKGWAFQLMGERMSNVHRDWQYFARVRVRRDMKARAELLQRREARYASVGL